jgi:hypothetical protein
MHGDGASVAANTAESRDGTRQAGALQDDARRERVVKR